MREPWELLISSDALLRQTIVFVVITGLDKAVADVAAFAQLIALWYIFVLSNYFCKYKSKKIFEKVKINMQTSSVHVLYPKWALSYLLIL